MLEQQITTLTKSRIYKVVMVFLFFTPIGIITYNIANWYYGAIVLELNPYDIDYKMTIITFLIFSVISILLRIVEDAILPMVIYPSLKPYSGSKREKLDNIFMDILIRIGKLDLFAPFKMQRPIYMAHKINGEITTVIILWLSLLNSWICAIPIVFVIVVSLFFAKGFNTIFAETYPIQNTDT